MHIDASFVVAELLGARLLGMLAMHASVRLFFGANKAGQQWDTHPPWVVV